MKKQATIINKNLNVWGIEEYSGDGVSCPIAPINLPWYKKAVLFLFRFGVCPLCMTMSIIYTIKKLFAGKRT